MSEMFMASADASNPPPTLGDEDFETLTNAARTTMLAAREAKRLANIAEGKATVDFIKVYTRWGIALKIPVGGHKLISTTFDGVPMIIKINQATAGNYGIQYIKEG